MPGMRQRQPDGECAAMTNPGARYVNLSVMGLDKRFRDGQSQPNAAGVTRSILIDSVESVKNT